MGVAIKRGEASVIYFCVELGIYWESIARLVALALFAFAVFAGHVWGCDGLAAALADVLLALLEGAALAVTITDGGLLVKVSKFVSVSGVGCAFFTDC